jgi:YVTN family beta-propeller protein
MLSVKSRMQPALRFLALCMLGSTLAYSSVSFAAEGASSEKSGVQTMLRNGISVEFEVHPDTSLDSVMAGKYANVKFKISDAQTGEPVKGIYPAVWLDMAKPWDQPDADASITCKERVQLYMQGIVGVRPLVDLNSYFILVMNSDATVSVIDPIIGVGGITKLYASISLPGTGAEWAKTYDEKFMYISIPTEDVVTKVDLTTFKAVTNVVAGDNPVRIAFQPDEKYLWVANNHRDEDKSGVSVVDTATDETVKFISTGGGHHELAFSNDSRYAYVSNRTEGSIVVIDISTLEKIKTVHVSDQAIDIAFSEKSEALYVSDGKAGQISVIDMNTHTIKRRIDVKVGVGPLGVSQDGRWLIAANSQEDEVYAIDVATNKLAHTLPVGRKPYQIAFTRAFAFIRSMGTERVSAIELAHLSSQKNVPVSSFQAGPNAPGKVRDLSLASAMSEAPGEAAILVVSPADNTVYYYMEGMNAPMGNFRNYGHRPRAVQVADRTLREEKDGIYQAKVRIPAAGTYDVAFLMESPSILHCFSMDAVPDPTKMLSKVPALEFIDIQHKAVVNEEVKVRFRLYNLGTGEPKTGLTDVNVRSFRAPVFDRRQVVATEVEDGVYEVDATLPDKGVYYFFVSTQSGGLDWGGDNGFQTIQVTRPVASAK